MLNEEVMSVYSDTSEMRFFRRKKKTSICIRLYKTEDICLPVCLSVFLLINKTSTNSLIFYFNKAKQKNVCSGYMKNKNIPKYFVLLSRNNPLMLKVKISRSKNYSNVSLPSIMEKIHVYGMHKLVGLQLF